MKQLMKGRVVAPVFAAVAVFCVAVMLSGCGYTHSAASEHAGHALAHAGHDGYAGYDTSTRVEANPEEITNDEKQPRHEGVVGAGVGRPFVVGGKRDVEEPARGRGNVVFGDGLRFGAVKVSSKIRTTKNGVLDYEQPEGYARIRGGLKGWAQNFSSVPVGGDGVVIGDGLRYGSLDQNEKIRADKDAVVHFRRPHLRAEAPDLSTMWKREGVDGSGTKKEEGEEVRPLRGSTVFGSGLSWGSIKHREKVRTKKWGIYDGGSPGFTIESP